MVNKSGNYEEDETDDNGFPKLYIRQKKLTLHEVSHLAILVFTFFLLAGITAWDVFFLEETYICSEDPSFYCFPIAVDNSAYNDYLNLAQAQEHPITDCSFWNSANVSSRITFRCFRWIFNSKALISTIGGLLTMFLVGVKLVSVLSVAIAKAVIEKVKVPQNIHCCSREYQVTVQRCLKWIRRTILMVVAAIELLLAAFLLCLFEQHYNSLNSKLDEIFVNHGNQILLIIGIFTTILLLPIEEYANPSVHREYERISDSGPSSRNGDPEHQLPLQSPESA